MTGFHYKVSLSSQISTAKAVNPRTTSSDAGNAAMCHLELKTTIFKHLTHNDKTTSPSRDEGKRHGQCRGVI